MFGRNPEDKEDADPLLVQDHWEQQAPSISDRNASSHSDIWEEDPLRGESHELQEGPGPESRHTAERPQGIRPKRPRPQPAEYGEAAAELEDEFERIFTPVKRDQEEQAKFYGEIDAACAAYSERLKEMQEQQREQEGAIERPWLMARRQRNWQRFLASVRVAGTVLTCFWGGTVASLEEIPSEVPWPPPHLTRMQERHAEERKALREAHLAVVHELRVKHKVDTDEDGMSPVEHVCVEQSLLLEIQGHGLIPSSDDDP